MSLRIEHRDGRMIEIGVMSIPYRKKKALVQFRGTNVEVLAYFLSEETSKQFEKIIDTIVDICKVDTNLQ